MGGAGVVLRLIVSCRRLSSLQSPAQGMCNEVLPSPALIG